MQLVNKASKNVLSKLQTFKAVDSLLFQDRRARGYAKKWPVIEDKKEDWGRVSSFLVVVGGIVRASREGKAF